MRLLKPSLNKKAEPDYESLYTNAFIRVLQNSVLAEDKAACKRAAYYGVKLQSLHCREKSVSYEEAVLRFQLFQSVDAIIGALTPAELLTVFPVDKKYDGSRYEMKDYFFTMNALREYGMDRPIGENVSDVLWDYMNLDVHIYLASKFGVVDELRRFTGEKGMIEEFMEGQGVTMHTLHTDPQTGKQFLQDGKTGEVTQVKKRIPRYLRLIKENV